MPWIGAEFAEILSFDWFHRCSKEIRMIFVIILPITFLMTFLMNFLLHLLMNFLINSHAPTQTFKILSRPQRTRLSNFKESPFAQCKALPRKWSQNIRKAIASILSSLPTSCPFCASMLRRCRQVLIVLTVLSFRFFRTVLQGRKKGKKEKKKKNDCGMKMK